MAKVESRCVLVPSSSVSLACIVGYLSSNRERERDGKSPSLFQTANVMTFFLYLLILGNENYVRDYYSLAEDRVVVISRLCSSKGSWRSPRTPVDYYRSSIYRTADLSDEQLEEMSTTRGRVAPRTV